MKNWNNSKVKATTVKTIDWLNWMSKTNIFLIVIMLIMLASGLTSTIRFGLGQTTPWGGATWSLAANNIVVAWFAVILSGFGPIFAIAGTFCMINTYFKAFGVVQLIYLVMLIPANFFLNFAYAAIMDIYLLIPAILYLIRPLKETKVLKKFGWRNTIVFWLVATALGVLLAYGITFAQKGSFFWDAAPWWDAINMSGSVYGWILAPLGYWEASVVWLVNSVTYFFQYLIHSQAWSIVVLYVFYFFMNVLMVINWQKEINGNFEKGLLTEQKENFWMPYSSNKEAIAKQGSAKA